jgi:hypothetical protein
VPDLHGVEDRFHAKDAFVSQMALLPRAAR